MIAIGHKISFLDDEIIDVLRIMVMVAYMCEYTRNH